MKEDVDRILKLDKLFKKPYNMDILSLALKGSSVTEISKNVDLSYTSVYSRLKELEENGIIDMKSGLKEGAGNEISISSKLPIDQGTLIKSEIGFYELVNAALFKTLEKDEKLTRKILKIIRENRFITFDALIELFEDDEKDKVIELLKLLERTNFLKKSFDVTKKGRNWLKK